jgi:hypothetical protein
MLLNICLLKSILESVFCKNIEFVFLLIMNFDIGEIWINSNSKIAWKSPRSSGPSDEASLWIFNQWECNDDGWVTHLLIV